MKHKSQINKYQNKDKYENKFKVMPQIEYDLNLNSLAVQNLHKVV